ncbi:putative sensor with HAMP domain [Parafrankia sp. EUN1f]|nr:putative sensor with HAMP domain [Parafrankia sp. EUN1f]
MTDPTNWRVRTKLIAILAVPVVAILVNSSIQAASVLTSTRDVNRIRDLIEINRSASTLVHALQEERTYTAGRIASSGSSSGGGSGSSAVASVAARQTATNDALTSYQNIVKRHEGSFGPEVRNSLRDTTNALGHLANLRKASTSMADPSSVRAAYSPLITSLIDLVVLIPQGNDDPALLRSVNAADHLVRANEEIATTQTLAYSVILSADPFSTDDYREFLTAHSQRIELVRAFEEDATPAQLARFREKLNPDESLDIKSTDLYTEQILEATTGQKLASPPSEKWARATQEWINLSSEVDVTLLDDIDNRVDELRGSIQRGALLSGLLIVFILASALLAAVVVARSLVRPLLSLRTAALDVAGRRLPDAVRRLRDSSDQTLNDDVEPIGIDSDEEIGEVARAFDAVHREAVRLASEQAVLRNNVNAMFVNLSRRSQGLVERQLRLIDDLENREQDPDQLANLFKLDHLATRMRRNNESLLVLAGTDTARRWTHPVPVNEVVLAAISEVEQYTRVKQTGAAPVSIAGSGVSDVVHLIAELLENATSYSPPVTDVLVSSHSLGPGAGAMIEIEDQGIGMPAKELERVNDRLANPPVVDVSVSRTMGLFAVGRLASRHGIRVQLRESASGGITAVVRLPAKLVTGDSGAVPGGPRPAALSPATGGRDAAASPALPPARGNALPPPPSATGWEQACRPRTSAPSSIQRQPRRPAAPRSRPPATGSPGTPVSGRRRPEASPPPAGRRCSTAPGRTGRTGPTATASTRVTPAATGTTPLTGLPPVPNQAAATRPAPTRCTGAARRTPASSPWRPSTPVRFRCPTATAPATAGRAPASSPAPTRLQRGDVSWSRHRSPARTSPTPVASPRTPAATPSTPVASPRTPAAFPSWMAATTRHRPPVRCPSGRSPAPPRCTASRTPTLCSGRAGSSTARPADPAPNRTTRSPRPARTSPRPSGATGGWTRRRAARSPGPPSGAERTPARSSRTSRRGTTPSPRRSSIRSRPGSSAGHPSPPTASRPRSSRPRSSRPRSGRALSAVRA